jgi:hypothetical protein
LQIANCKLQIAKCRPTLNTLHLLNSEAINYGAIGLQKNNWTSLKPVSKTAARAWWNWTKNKFTLVRTAARACSLVTCHCSTVRWRSKRACASNPVEIGRTADQGCRARLPSKAAGQGCWARLPGKSAGQVCRARLLGKVTCMQWHNMLSSWKHGEIGRKCSILSKFAATRTTRTKQNLDPRCTNVQTRVKMENCAISPLTQNLFRSFP